MEQHERAGAVRALRHAGAKTGLPEQRSLLIAHEASDRDPVREERNAAGDAEDLGRVAHPRQDGSWDPQQIEQLVVPVDGVEIEQQRPARVRRVRRVFPRESRAEPGIDGPEREVARLRLAPRARYVVEEPLHLGSAEVGVEHEARTLAEQGSVPGFLELAASARGAAILPDERAMDGPAGGALPEHRRLSLVRDAEGPDAIRLHPGGAEDPRDR